ncbi:helix-turn-helix domain-containing protein [Tatumella citrea]|uniref:HTH cro/C1-type domain-containing protein n=1 Tax=Tatumella citrea TaxID=53336 RepID=A0A1Y0L773_TATCI|nr:helix-turn-helix domain-containing protein [Tatumella citrea]ARU93884.1 hypothetical protein A7K98_08910 [Tatumella citrea]ARU97922.1 hypothetical protein A7K99_08910 [Tatumella citrea]
METVEDFLATALKEVRKQRQLSLAQCAEKTGVSKTMLGQIERCESSPTVATLWKIASGLKLPFSWFIPREEIPDRSQALKEPSQMQARPLLPYDPQLAFDLLFVTLPGGVSSHSSPHVAGVTEQVIVISGTLLLVCENSRQLLAPGQAYQFAGDQPHSYINPGTELCCFHSLIHYPRPVEPVVEQAGLL